MSAPAGEAAPGAGRACPMPGARAAALLRRAGDGDELVVSPLTPSWAITEVRRRHGPVPLRQAADAELESLLTAAADAPAMPPPWSARPRTRLTWTG